MTVPEVGKTHDIVIYSAAGNIAPVGLIVAEGSYRVSRAAEFNPRLTVGPVPRSYEMWEALSQTDFRAGSGQALLIQANRYHLSVGALPDRVTGHLGFKVHAGWHTMSDSGGWYNVMGPSNFMQVGLDGFVTSGKHLWKVYPECVTIHQTLNTGTIVSAVRYSGQILMSTRTHSLWGDQVNVWDAKTVFNTLGHIPTEENAVIVFNPETSTEALKVTIPAYSTTAGRLAMYDSKVWRTATDRGRISYLTPSETTVGVQWSKWIDVCPAPINGAADFLGRLFLGAPTGLYAYEAGRSYRVVDLTSLEYQSNCQLMRSHQGALYFNVRDRLYRYTSGGLLEELDFNFGWPFEAAGCDAGLIVATNRSGGKSMDSNLAAPGSRVETQGYMPLLTVLDPQTGGAFPVTTPQQWKAGDYTTFARVSMGELHGLTPIVHPYIGYSSAGPGGAPAPQSLFYLRTEDHNYPSPMGEITVPRYFRSNSEKISRFKSSEIDLGYPDRDKRWSKLRLVLDLATEGASDYGFCDVYYRLKGGAQSWTSDDWAGWTYLTRLVVSGSFSMQLPHLESRSIAIGLEFYGTLTPGGAATAIESPTLKAFEVEGVVDYGKRLKHHFNAVIVDGILNEAGVVENSAAFLAASMHSLTSGSAVHVVATPYPTTGHTTWARVELVGPGVLYPVIAYDEQAVTQMPSGMPGHISLISLTEIGHSQPRSNVRIYPRSVHEAAYD